ncbi:MAG: hypothetical protein R6U96_18490 [Promethearchaeia archaeon]
MAFDEELLRYMIKQTKFSGLRDADVEKRLGELQNILNTFVMRM